MNSDIVVNITNLNKSFGDNHVLRGIDLQVQRGEVVCIIGPSGSGKSTLLRCVNMLETPTAGTVVVLGRELTNIDCDLDEARTHIGMVFQQFHLFPHMNVLDNLTYGPINVIKLSKKKSEEKAILLLKQFGILEKIYSDPSELSGGQKQRLCIARALYKNPEILILDEATSALDTESEKLVQDALDQLMQDRTVLIIAHRLSTVRKADEIIVLSQGKIIERGNHDSLMTLKGTYFNLCSLQGMRD